MSRNHWLQYEQFVDEGVNFKTDLPVGTSERMSFKTMAIVVVVLLTVGYFVAS